MCANRLNFRSIRGDDALLMSLICAALVHFLRPEASAEHNTPPGASVDPPPVVIPSRTDRVRRLHRSDAVTDNSRPSLPGRLFNIQQL